ncbi:hypothetical protein PCH_Pc12g08880 [Penicillium rubens Wisconsin 54-1255]|uniref:Uncharacterized protein n=1 Tax=Penicillium rubens (strain ATCC 28089 / DSM 1075 / NRRL 1951 / Wisconsin 54-1255) TaxID=500485 RepID=B6GYL6_PENRW|nr:hypothetical protein PCH_Pc12g08880 [Penicillium rubens Wisconsin 54-1255]
MARRTIKPTGGSHVLHAERFTGRFDIGCGPLISDKQNRAVTWAQVRLFYPGFFPIYTPRDRSGKAGGKCLKVNLTCSPITNNLVTRKRWKRSKVGRNKRTPLEACWNISKVIKSQCVKGDVGANHLKKLNHSPHSSAVF